MSGREIFPPNATVIFGAVLAVEIYAAWTNRPSQVGYYDAAPLWYTTYA